MKRCTKCGKDKPLDEFYKKSSAKDGKMPNCISCQKEYKQTHYKNNSAKVYDKVKERRHELRDKLWAYKQGKKCVDCSETNPIVFEFDHLSDKEHNVSKMVLDGRSWEAILREIQKCEIVCANCHRIRTHSRGGWVRNITIKVEPML
ncbi:HNH endonuclease [Streptomyces phage Tribute]|uniref:HNH endonuclease n=1 Tax=Streptomyces phage Tribute TaxID=2653772 RepID=A0A5Q2WK57_9CAUD|nr:HNH endonuclease [Streptomyces phage Tribute]